MADKTATAKRLGIPTSALVIGLVILLGLGILLYLEYEANKGPAPGPVLTGEAKAYVRHLRLSEVGIKKTESYLKQSVVEITGKISNAGDRVLHAVQVNCVFYDAYGQVVLRERMPIVGEKTGSLAPGQTRVFRLAFDNLPESWNQDMPQLVIAEIVFA